MNILFLVDGRVLHMGGAELQAFSLAQHLCARSHQVEVVAPYLDRSSPQNTVHKGIKVRQLGYWRFPKLSSIIFMLRFACFLAVEGRKYDAIHIHMVHKMASVVGLMRWFVPCPVIAKVSGAYELYDGKKSNVGKFGSLQYWTYKAIGGLDYFQAISAETVRRLGLGGIDGDKIMAIPNGVDTDAFALSSALHAANQQGNDAQQKTVISFCGRLVPVKGLDILLDASAKLQQLHPNAFEIHLHGDGPLKEELQAQAAKLSISEAVHFRGKSDNVAQSLRDAHVYVQVSRYEGLSNAVLEAMSCGLPLVLSAVGGNNDVVSPGVNGSLVEAENVDSLVTALSTLITDREKCRQMGLESRKRAERDFSLKSVSDRLLALYKNQRSSKKREDEIEVTH